MSPKGYSIGTRIFGAFIAMSAIIAVLGAAGYFTLSAAGDMAVTTFDGPLMAINFARAAQTDFTQLKMDELRYEDAAAGEKRPSAVCTFDFCSQIVSSCATFSSSVMRASRSSTRRSTSW